MQNYITWRVFFFLFCVVYFAFLFACVFHLLNIAVVAIGRSSHSFSQWCCCCSMKLLILLMLLLSLGVVVLFFSMQSLFPLNIVVAFLNIVLSLWHNYNYSLPPLCSFCYSMILLLLDVAFVLFQHCSCSFPIVFLINTTPLLLLLLVVPFQCPSYSYSSMPLLLFIFQVPLCFPSMLLFFHLLMLLMLLVFQSGTSLLHIFASVGKENFPNSIFLGQAWRWVFSKCLFVDDLFLVLIIHVFWDNFGWQVFISYVQDSFGHCKFNFTNCILILNIAFNLHICIVFF